jgi:hypothetical protein
MERQRPPIADIIGLRQLLAGYAAGLTKDDVESVARPAPTTP